MVLALPFSITRWIQSTGLSVPPAASLFATAVYALSGTTTVLIFVFTRPNLLLFRSSSLGTSLTSGPHKLKSGKPLPRLPDGAEITAFKSMRLMLEIPEKAHSPCFSSSSSSSRTRACPLPPPPPPEKFDSSRRWGMVLTNNGSVVDVAPPSRWSRYSLDVPEPHTPVSVQFARELECAIRVDSGFTGWDTISIGSRASVWAEGTVESVLDVKLDEMKHV
jgi:hypothetical protein